MLVAYEVIFDCHAINMTLRKVGIDRGTVSTASRIRPEHGGSRPVSSRSGNVGLPGGKVDGGQS